MLEPVTDTIFGNPVFAGLAAFSATSVTLAAVSWFASPVFGCSRRRAGWRGASGEIVLSGRLSRWSRTVLSERTTLSRKGPAQGREDPRGKEILPSIDFEALQRELDDAFAPVGRDRGKNLMSGPDIVRAFVGCLPPSECDDGGDCDLADPPGDCDLPDPTGDGNEVAEIVGRLRRRQRRAGP